MKISTSTVILSLFCVLVGWAFTGCETQSASTQVRIDPDHATLLKGQSVTLTVSGADPG